MGKTKIRAYASEVLDGKVYLCEDTGDDIHTNDVIELFDFLLEYYEDTIKICWSLDEFVSSFLHLMGREICEKLAGDDHTAFYRPYRIFYIPNKVFSIKRGINRADIYGIDQYYNDFEEPSGVKAVRSDGELLLHSLGRMGQFPKKLSSLAKIFEECVMDHLEIPTVDDIPEKDMEVIEYAWQCCGRLWISAYQVGAWGAGESFTYDISSAFPWEMTQVFSTKHCTYTKSKTYVEGAHWGFLRGRVTIDAPVSPIIYRRDDNTLINPVGSWDGFITLGEARYIEKYKIGSFKMKDGWFLHFRAPVKPLRLTLKRLYEIRMTNEFIDVLAKRQGVACYGKFLEQHSDGGYGKFYNPLWAAQISTRTRLRVGAFIERYKLQENLLHVGVDGLQVDRYVDIPKSSKMGTWRCKGAEPVIVVSPGLLFYGDKHPKGIDHAKLVELILANPNRDRYECVKERRYTLMEAVQFGHLPDVGKMKRFSTAVDLKVVEQDRHFPKLPRTGKTLINMRYKSKPLVIDGKRGKG